MSYVDEYIHKHLGLKDDNKGFNIELINGRMKEIFDCVSHLERIRNNYACEVMQEWSKLISVDFPECQKVEGVHPSEIIYTGITIPYKDIPEAIAIRIQMEKRSLYYGLTYMPAIKEKRAENIADTLLAETIKIQMKDFRGTYENQTEAKASADRILSALHVLHSQ